MKDFRTSFSRFYAGEAIKILRYPKATALFEREVTALLDGFKKYLVDHYMSRKGLTLKLFKSGLEKKGFILVSKRK